MKTFHIHIQGIVQGVGFRPFVYKLAAEMGLSGWVNNTSDGVHIRLTTQPRTADLFLKRVLAEKPQFAVITRYDIKEVGFEPFQEFEIVRSEDAGDTRLLVTPDFAMCPECKDELYDTSNRRYLYPFITCTNCGPRYSIIKSLPYDRPTTTMAPFQMCPACQAEYDDPLDRRYYSQTNSCPDCAVELALWQHGQFFPAGDEIGRVVQAWKEGKIVAIKGIGGYLLTCDATNASTIKRLRKLKQRPTKPFALMYPDTALLDRDLQADVTPLDELQSVSSPIVLLPLKKGRENHSDVALGEIAPGLSRIGVMLPYTPLYDLLLRRFEKPIIATSGNISGSVIIYNDEQAIKYLSKIADLILLNNREIVLAQDDSVVQYSLVHQQKIILRRSRGLAPSFLYTSSSPLPDKTILSLGAMLKSTFALLHSSNILVSQYLGNTDVLDAQENYEKTLKHLLAMFQASPEWIAVDKHPKYYTTELGRNLARQFRATLLEVQHHKAHFWALLGEHDLLMTDEKILGVIWDGTGYGDDGQIWGGEFFLYADGKMTRVAHLEYYNFILGDKMPREPRISALAISGGDTRLMPKFTEEEWRIYQKLLSQDNNLQSSSVGRLFDAAASIILNIDRQSYEGEAAILLESAAAQYFRENAPDASFSYLSGRLPVHLPEFLVSALLKDKASNHAPEYLAAKFHTSLAHYISLVARKAGAKKVGFSGGVFQNAWLVDLVYLFMAKDFELFFHKNLSPNDEAVSFGQLMAAMNIDT